MNNIVNQPFPTSLPLLDHPVSECAVFRPENLLERAAAMHGTESGSIPAACVLDFDAELVPVALEQFGAAPSPEWACFHTTLLRLAYGGQDMGLIGGTVGAPFAVLICEQLIASGCRWIIGYSSAGAVADGMALPCIVVPDRALRDEGTSYHYLSPGAWVESRGMLALTLARHADQIGLPVHRGATWTTDAPYRETRSQVGRHRAEGILSVEMESAALMALAQAREASGIEIASLLHVTNTLATGAEDFYKGPKDINTRVIACCLEVFAQMRREES